MDEDNKKQWKLVNFCEIDKFAVKSYCAIHNVDESLNLGDITKVDESSIEPFNMITGGSPCQDFSMAGKQAGSIWTCKDCKHSYNPLTVHYSERGYCPNCKNKNIDKTRSSLLVEWLRIIRVKKPVWGIYENVKNIISKKFKNTFDMFIQELQEYGYNTYWTVLNAKNFGIPQNRERLFLVIILKEYDNGKFVFSKGFDRKFRLRDILENNVDEKYYVSNEKTKKFLVNMDMHEITDHSFIDPQGRKNKKCIPSETIPTLRAESHGNPPLVIEIIQNQNSNVSSSNNQNEDNIRIRKLTPKECFRLMGFNDSDFEKASSVVSNSQLYKQAGNSIVVNVLYFIFVELYKAMPYLFEDLKVASFFSGIGAYERALDNFYNDYKSYFNM